MLDHVGKPKTAVCFVKITHVTHIMIDDYQYIHNTKLPFLKISILGT